MSGARFLVRGHSVWFKRGGSERERENVCVLRIPQLREIQTEARFFLSTTEHKNRFPLHALLCSLVAWLRGVLAGSGSSGRFFASWCLSPVELGAGAPGLCPWRWFVGLLLFCFPLRGNRPETRAEKKGHRLPRRPAFWDFGSLHQEPKVGGPHVVCVVTDQMVGDRPSQRQYWGASFPTSSANHCCWAADRL